MHTPQSLLHVEQDSLPVQTPSPHSWQAPQSVAHVAHVSAPLHVASPQ
jgi:hypothetical protein